MVHANYKVDQSIRANGINTVNVKEKVYRLSQMELNTKAIGNMTNQMVMAEIFNPMEIATMVNYQMAKHMEKELMSL